MDYQSGQESDKKKIIGLIGPIRLMRINKYLADSGFCSRRKADKLIEDGKVMINGTTAELGSQVEKSDDVFVNGQLIAPRQTDDIFIMFNKPVGVICSFDEKAHNTLADWVDVGERIFHVGRLDVASSGLLLLTNNGDISEAITHPRGEHEKEYVVTVDKPFNRAFLEAMRQGVQLDDGLTKPARAKKVSNTRFELILTEGRNRQIRRMCEKLGYDVKKLKRVRVLNIKLGDLGEGNWRHLTKKERRELLDKLK